jgi:GNAT superfamily N-acetyltransferase
MVSTGVPTMAGASQLTFTIHELGRNPSRTDMRRIGDIFFQCYTEPPHEKVLKKRGDATKLAKMMVALREKRGDSAILLVARNSRNRIVGMALGERYDPEYHNHRFDKLLEPGNYYHLHGVFVDRDFRREKISTMLTDARLSHARSIGCTYALSDTHAANKPRISQFLRDGFTPVKSYFHTWLGSRVKSILFQRRL